MVCAKLSVYHEALTERQCGKIFSTVEELISKATMLTHQDIKVPVNTEVDIRLGNRKSLAKIDEQHLKTFSILLETVTGH